MRIFLTGGSGFLGQRIIRRLAAAHHQVVALARSDAAARSVVSAGATSMAGDVAGAAGLSLAGFPVVIHAAAPVVFWGEWQMYQRDIVDASLALYRCAAAQGVRRFIYISSESVLQGSGSLLDIDDSQAFADPPNSDYGRAKKAAELALQAAWRDTPHCELIVLRPSFIWAADAPALELMASKLKAGQFAWVDKGQAPFEAVHVDNVAAAVEAALARGKPGAAYLITDDRPWTARGLLAPLLSEKTGIPVPERSVPSWLANALASVLEGLWRGLRLWRNPPPLTRFDVAFMSQPRRYRIDGAKQELGYAPAYVGPASVPQSKGS